MANKTKQQLDDWKAARAAVRELTATLDQVEKALHPKSSDDLFKEVFGNGFAKPKA